MNTTSTTRSSSSLFSCRFCGLGYLALNCFALVHTAEGSSGLAALHLQRNGKTVLRRT